MSRFLNLLKVTPYGDGQNWCLLEDFSFERGAEGSGLIITVPKLFITDFASVPRAFWNVIPPWGKYGFAAVIHDYLYYDQTLPKKDADEILMDGMEVLGVGTVERDIIYEAVSKAGQAAWDENTKKKATGFIRIADELPRSVLTTAFYWTGK